MLSDDALTTRLSGAMREATDDLTWNGRTPRARRTPTGAALAVPALVAVAAVGGVAAWQSDRDPAPPAAGPTPGTGTATGPSAEALVTETVQLAGMQLTVQHRAGEELVNDLSLMMGAPLPPDAEEVPVDGPGTAWVGTTEDGVHGLWVRSPVRGGEQMLTIVSPTWSLETFRSVAVDGFPAGVQPTP